jgi:peroxiredoxin
MRLLALTALLLLFAFGGVALAADAADFDLKDLDGDEYTLDDLLSGTNLLVIDFWQVGCKPCNELVAHLQEMYDEYQKEDKGVEFVIISRDTALTLAQVAPFFHSHEYTFRVLLDTELDVSTDYGVKASPATFLINPDGEIVYQHYSYKPGQEEEIKNVIDRYLAGEEIEATDEAEATEEADAETGDEE